MPKVVITGDGSSNTVNVSDASDAVRKVSTQLRKVASDTSVLKVLQAWANTGFKNPLRLDLGGKSLVIDYRE